MKTILFNTQTEKTVGKIREGSFNGIWNSALSTVPGWTPEHIVELDVILNEPPEYDPQTQNRTSEWVVDLEAGTYTKEWTVTDLTDEEIAYKQALQDWLYLEYAKRIIAPIELAMDDNGAKIAIWFQLNGFPIEKIDQTVHLYCNVILEEHQDIADAFGEVITIEDRPEILNG